MKQNNIRQTELLESKSSFHLISDEVIDTLVAKQDKILALLEAKKEVTLNGYVKEKQAMELINKKATWFWQMRKTGQLAFIKIGQTIYYKLDDLNSLFQSK
jgi:lipoate-protein ligase B